MTAEPWWEEGRGYSIGVEGGEVGGEKLREVVEEGSFAICAGCMVVRVRKASF